MSLNPQETADLVTFTYEFVNGKLHFFVQCMVQCFEQFNYVSARCVLPTQFSCVSCISVICIGNKEFVKLNLNGHTSSRYNFSLS